MSDYIAVIRRRETRELRVCVVADTLEEAAVRVKKALDRGEFDEDFDVTDCDDRFDQVRDAREPARSDRDAFGELIYDRVLPAAETKPCPS